MALLIGATLAVVSILILVYPFLKARIRAQPEDSPSGAPIPIGGLEAVYQEISTLRLEYQLGKVPEDVYQEQLRAYRLQAAVALQQQAQAGPPLPADDPWDQDAGAVPGEPRCNRGDSLPARCPHCGAAAVREDGVCSACNANLAGSDGDAL